MEIWKDIIGFEGKYLVSDQGRVKSLSRLICKNGRGRRVIPERILRVSVSDKGYCRVSPCGVAIILVHRIVAQAFIPNPENKPEVNHKNGIKSDNRAENLEWSTRSENEQHARKLGLKKALLGERHPSSKISDSIREQIISLYKEGQKMSCIARQFHLTDEYVMKLLKRRGVHVKKRRDHVPQPESRRLWKREYQKKYWARRKDKSSADEKS